MLVLPKALENPKPTDKTNQSQKRPELPDDFFFLGKKAAAGTGAARSGLQQGCRSAASSSDGRALAGCGWLAVLCVSWN